MIIYHSRLLSVNRGIGFLGLLWHFPQFVLDAFDFDGAQRGLLVAIGRGFHGPAPVQSVKDLGEHSTHEQEESTEDRCDGIGLV